MKKIRLLMFAMLLCPLFLAAGCNWLFNDDSDGIPVGMLFYTGCPLSFYYVDEHGNDQIDLQNPATFPTAFRVPVAPFVREEAVGSLTETSLDGATYYLYNSGSNSLREDAGPRYAFQTYLWGKTLDPDYTMYVYTGDSKDSLKVSYRYLRASESDGLPSGASWGVEVTSICYNEVEVFQNNENGKVFIEKPSQGGETVVHVGTI